MDQGNVEAAPLEATPIFGAYRRGYDPVQVDRYVADQQRRLDEALTRASEAERKLAAAVGQLRELHRRVAVLESEDRSPQPAPLDALGERVQRILQEAWEGAYALRQQAETEAAALREEVAGESAATITEAEQRADAIVEGAERRASAIDAEIERRRLAWNARLEEDRAKAVAQIGYLHTQRSEAVGELLRLQEMIERAVRELGNVNAPTRASSGADDDASVAEAAAMAALAGLAASGSARPGAGDSNAGYLMGETGLATGAASEPLLAGSTPIDTGVTRAEEPDGAEPWSLDPRLVGSEEPAVRVVAPAQPPEAGPALPVVSAGPATVFDFEEEQPS
jgi:cell division septum initiation protein DivIVA